MTVEYKKERKELYCSAMNAILDLVPEGKFSIQGNDLSTIDWQGGGTQPSDSAITAKIAERETAWDATEEARVSRFIAYPDIKEQLDKLFHDIDEGKLDKTGSFYTALKAVKEANLKRQIMATTKVQSELIADDVALAGNPTTSTQQAVNSTTSIATTAFVTTAVNNLIDSAPGTMDTLNEIAAALGDDPSFTTTVNNAIATKLPLSGGTMTGNIAHAGNFTIDAGGDIILDADGGDIKFQDGTVDIFSLINSSSDIQLKAAVQDKDMIFRGNDGGTIITALTLDMSDAERPSLIISYSQEIQQVTQTISYKQKLLLLVVDTEYKLDETIPTQIKVQEEYYLEIIQIQTQYKYTQKQTEQMTMVL